MAGAEGTARRGRRRGAVKSKSEAYDSALELAKLMGNVTGQEEESLKAMCKLAVDRLAARLKPGVTIGDCESAFAAGAAWLALSEMSAGHSGVSRFTAGNVTIQQTSAGGDRADNMRRQAELVMAPYLRDDGFSFMGVRG